MLSDSKGTRETILVVDDNEAVLQSWRLYSKARTSEYSSADSPTVALRLAEEKDEKIDLLLSDVEMPQMSGPDLER